MKRNREVYKFGRMVMNSLRVPLARKGSGTKYDDTFNIQDSKGNEVPYHYSHYSKDYDRTIPKRKSDGSYDIGSNGSMAVNHISYKAGQARLRKPKTCSEAEKYYGSAINDVVKSGIASLENSLYSRGIAHSYSASAESKSSEAPSASVATSASSSSASQSNVDSANHSEAPKSAVHSSYKPMHDINWYRIHGLFVDVVNNRTKVGNHSFRNKVDAEAYLDKKNE